jgi:hypothetical protein
LERDGQNTFNKRPRVESSLLCTEDTVADKTGAQKLKSTLHLRLLWHIPSERQSKIYIMLCKPELCRTSLRQKVIFSDFLHI